MMSLPDTAIWLGLEFTVLIVSAALLVLGISWCRRRRDRRAAAALVARIDQAWPERQQSLTQWLSQDCGLEAEEVKAQLDKIIQAERLLLQAVIDMYINRDAEALQEFDNAYVQSVQSYADIKLGAQVVAEDSDEQPSNKSTPVAAFDAAISRLKHDNEGLQKELHTAQHIMDDIMREYVVMYSGDTSKAADPERLKEIIAAAKTQPNEQDTEQTVAEESAERTEAAGEAPAESVN